MLHARSVIPTCFAKLVVFHEAVGPSHELLLLSFKKMRFLHKKIWLFQKILKTTLLWKSIPDIIVSICFYLLLYFDFAVSLTQALYV